MFVFPRRDELTIRNCAGVETGRLIKWPSARTVEEINRQSKYYLLVSRDIRS